MNERGEEHRSDSVPDLEEPLRIGDAVLFGQIGWSTANRGTERPTAGDVITLKGDGAKSDETSHTARCCHRH